MLSGPGTAGPRAGAPETVIPVRYDGEDLAEVAALTGLSPEEVVARHVAPRYTVAFTGFAPGFAYLSGGDTALTVPRRSTPRPRIPAGSVGLAGAFSGVYPRESPGGWQLIGRTGHRMWDLGREQPAALLPGAAVRFEAVREAVEVDDAGAGAAAQDRTQTEAQSQDRTEARDNTQTGTQDRNRAPTQTAQESADPGATPVLEILDPGLQTLIQDAGRPGLTALGVSASGAADRGALARANRLAGNPEDAAALELGFGAFEARGVGPGASVLALAGAPREGRITGPFGTRRAPAGRAFRLDPGELLRLEAPARGLRTVLAVRGGVAAGRTLGSRSADTLAGLGPAPLAEGDVVRAGAPGRAPVGLPEPDPAELPAPGEEARLRVVPGPREEWFGAEGLRALWETAWEVTPRSDRVGVRLAGDPLTRTPEHRERELPSEGLATGAIQVPADGQPVLFLADRPLTGGYPVIGVVCEADLGLAAQLPPGARVRFEPLAPAEQDGAASGVTDPPAPTTQTPTP
ncbi:urea amidolyase family protein [Rothia sp. AR01]|uniref:Urea amidolyase family protein n=1 Tax=Rothia santali TaxID=2949643 RepID=A0A9X2HC45_9MICC|nr:urea amidolyase family protein [Rothia santali]